MPYPTFNLDYCNDGRAPEWDVSAMSIKEFTAVYPESSPYGTAVTNLNNGAPETFPALNL